MKYSIAICLLATCLVADEPLQTTPEHLEFVRSKVVPLLKARCFECHGDTESLKGGLSLGGRKAMLAGGDSGPVIVPGKPDESLLMEAVRYESFEMPPRSKMPDAEIAIFEKWIAEGAHWPKELESADEPSVTEFPLEERRSSHWAWQPESQPEVPNVRNAQWQKDAIDAFVLSKLEAQNLKPAPDADRYTLIRRLYFDLIGLPPTIPQIEAFVNDANSDDAAMAKVVEELLASPHFGERWGRHWLDLVRYAETLGHEFDYPLHHAWQYRDYVIRAFNEDVPYDQFVTEHIAGDLIPNPRRHSTEGYNEAIIATGFWFLCEDKHAPVDVKREEASKIDNQIDVFSKSFMGMTVACARCHDHKFDAISTKDYYALAGFLQSSRRETAWLDRNGKIAARVKQLAAVRAEAEESLQPMLVAQADLSKLQQYIVAAVELVRAKVPLPLTQETAANYSELEQSVLNRWCETLADGEQMKPGGTLSLLAELAHAPNEQGFIKRVKAWKNAVNAGRARESESTLFANLTTGLPDDWFQTGHAFLQPSEGAQLGLVAEQPLLTSGQGVNSGGLSKELRGTVFSPTFELSHPEILVRVAGEGCKVRLIIDGYQMFEFNGLLFNGCKQAIDTKGEEKWLRLGADIHRYQGHRAHLEFLDEGNGWFAVKEVRFANRRAAAPPQTAPAPINQVLGSLADDLPATTSEVVDYWLKAATENTDSVNEALVRLNLLPGLQSSKAWQEVQQKWVALAKGVPAPMPVIALTDGTPENEFVFIRGSHKNLGEVAERNILTAVRHDNAVEYSGSGRLELTEQLFTEGNPLPARVAVNRIWHHLFGKGIVESTDNFGVLGKAPTHPALLDHLAVQFRADGWSIKKMIRSLVLTRTYRMSSQRSREADIKDPMNELIHRARIRRLTGEAVRDAILAVSGRLDTRQFGVPVPVKLTGFMQGRGRPKKDGPTDGHGRRSIYIAVNRNFLSPFMQAFDVPAPVSTTGKRTVSNVPAQALIMLNNEFVNQQAGLWAESLLKTEPKSDSELLARAWYQLLGRPVTAEETEILQSFLTAGDGRLTAESLTEICHILLNSKEFLFMR